MPNNVVFRRPFTKRGQNWLPPTKPPLADVTGSGGLLIGGSATIGYGQQVGSAIGAGGVKVGGTGAYQFVHGPQVPSGIVVEWDLDNDGDFSETVEDITPYVTSVETFAGRDWPSLLTGRAGPGKLRASLRNDDDRFSYFNTSSPLATAPFSLKTGRKVRVRTTTADNPDPAPLARDRFRRAAGALGTEEFGLTYVEPLAADFTISGNRAVASSEGSAHMAVVDTGGTDYYIQVKVSVLGGADPTNKAGVVYRYVDSDDYSLCIINAQDGSVQLVNVVSGVEEIVAAHAIEVYSGVSVGVHVSGTTVSGYVEGVELVTATAINATAESAGFYATWSTGDDRPEIDEFFVWSGLPITTEGVLWTGDIADTTATVLPGPEKVATISGEGWLSKLSAQQITPPASITGRPTGLLAGNALAKALQIHPPGQIDLGDVTTGTFAMPERSALAIARDVEEAEFGFLYETPEGYLSFRDRSHRDGSVSQVTFTDDPNGKYHYHRIEPYDWRKEVFNRVLAGVSPWAQGSEAVLYTDPGPYVLTSGQTQTIQASYEGTVVRWTGHSRDVTAPGGNPDGVTLSTYTTYGGSASVPLPAAVDAGDLLLIVCSFWPDNGSSFAGFDSTPSGFNVLQIGTVDCVVAKVATGSEDGGTAFFSCLDSGGTWLAHVFHVTDWIGTLSGVTAEVGVFGTGAQPNPPSISFPWGPLPTLVLAYATWPYDRSVSSYPSGYSDGEFTEKLDSGPNAIDIGLASAQRIVTGSSSTNPGVFTLSSSVNQWRARTIAIQGPAAPTTVTSSSPSGADGSFTIAYDNSLGGTAQTHANIEVTGIPLVQGDQTFTQVDDYDSQDDHNGIRTYQNSASLFANPTDAETYANLVLATYADDRPILALSFYPSKSAAYRAQAIRRRIGDRITVEATHNAGLGISQDFYIESISHKWSHGTRLWETTWELSPA